MIGNAKALSEKFEQMPGLGDKARGYILKFMDHYLKSALTMLDVIVKNQTALKTIMRAPITKQMDSYTSEVGNMAPNDINAKASDMAKVAYAYYEFMVKQAKAEDLEVMKNM